MILMGRQEDRFRSGAMRLNDELRANMHRTREVWPGRCRGRMSLGTGE